jgi:hypothetical protein
MSAPGKKPRSFRLQKSGPAEIGFLCAVAGALLPMANPGFLILLSMPLFIAALVLAIVALVRGGTLSGILLLITIFFAVPISFVTTAAGGAARSRLDQARATKEQREKPSRRVAAPRTSPILTDTAAPASPTLPETIALTQSISIALPYGKMVVPAGTKLHLVSRNGENVQIRYLDADYEIPISATDLK